MKKLFLGSVVATLVLFVWGAVFWSSSAPYSRLPRLPDEPAASRLLLDLFPASGTYLVPDPRSPGGTLNERSLSGPTATVHIRREGRPATDPRTFLLGFLHQLATVLLLALLLRRVLPVTPTYPSRVAFVATLGGIITFFSTLAPVIWWRHPAAFHLINATYELAGWILAALLLAHFVRPEPGSGSGSISRS